MTAPTRPTLRGTFGMVSSTHWLASQSAMAELENGGNAFDAAVAAGFVLHVVEPHLNGPGGEVPAVFATAADASPTVLCGQGPAPAGATRRALPLPRARPDSRLGPDRGCGTRRCRRVAAAVARPRHEVAARGARLRDRLRARRASVAPARRRPRRDHVADCSPSTGRRRRSAGCRGARRRHTGSGTSTRSTPTCSSGLVTEGESAGASREAQIDAARRAWGQGFVAEQVDRVPAGAAPGCQWQRPCRPGHRRRTWPGTPRRTSRRSSAGSATSRSPRRARGARARCCSSRWRCSRDCPTSSSTRRPPMACTPSPRCSSWPLPTGRRGTATRRTCRSRCCSTRHMSPERLRAGRHRGVPRAAARLARRARAARRRASAARRRASTCRPGSASRPCRGRGRPAATRATSTWSTAGATSSRPRRAADGCRARRPCRASGSASAAGCRCSGSRTASPATVAPGRRPRTTLSPTLVHRDGEPVMACGSPGGDQQDQWQLLFLLRHLVGGQTLQQAIDAPTWHTTSLPGSFYPREIDAGRSRRRGPAR